MKSSWLFIVNRALSGIVNGLFYAGGGWALWLALVLLLGSSVITTIPQVAESWHYLKTGGKVMCVLGILASVACVFGLTLSFFKPKWKFSDIHLWTFSHQTALSGTLFFAKVRWWILLLSVSPSAFFQKLFINLIGGNSWDYRGTDTSHGRWWSSKLFPRLRIPRLRNMTLKLVIAFVCLLLLLYLTIVKPKWSTHNPGQV